MPIPDFKAILAVARAFVPGFFGEKIYRLLVGVRWGESQIESLARMVGFTLSGFLPSQRSTMKRARIIEVFPIRTSFYLPR